MSAYLRVLPQLIPHELKTLKQWCVWKSLNRNGKVTKIPHIADGSGYAKANDLTTWRDFESAMSTYSAGRRAGIGFMFARDGDYTGVDLDSCFDEDGALTPEADGIVKRLDSYTEKSVSGRGLHIIVKAQIKCGHRHGKIEIYPHLRYFTFTGHVIDGYSQIQSRQKELEHLAGALERLKQSNVSPKQSIPQARYLCNVELIEKAKSAANGVKFSQLWQGETAGYNSVSEADLALLSMLMFWTHGDEDRTDLLFRQSGLYRDKWNRPDYRRRTFERLRQGGVKCGQQI
ncbi:hypothetical protein FACS1894187_18690 [Synergistales bacterium]|nr:hypothetical protein FACS1894187_18690 [Synergistales bacterium]